MSQSRYIIKSIFWSILAKTTDSSIKIISVPLLLNYFGKENFGLLALAISTNAYMQLLDLGINTGAIKFFSQWIGEKNFNLIDTVSRTSISFYGLIGLLNAFILIALSFYGTAFFNIGEEHSAELSKLFIILAIFSIINWGSSVFNQLLIADEKIPFIQVTNIAKSLINLSIIYTTLTYGLSLISYFFYTSIANSLIVIPYYIRTKQLGLVKSYKPAFNWNDFKPILKYSIAIFLMGIFQMTAMNSRPIILAVFSTEGVGIITEYRILETIVSFVIVIGGMFISIFLPKAARLVHKNNQTEIRKFAYNSTSHTSIIVILLCFPLLINTNEIITVYVGSEYSFLANWLIVWLVTVLIYLHNTPVSSLVLATGKTRPLVYSSALACTVSLVINAVLCPIIGVGSAIIGYSSYIIIQMLFYYCYFNTKILLLDSFKVFSAFFCPLLIAAISTIPILSFNLINLESLIAVAFLKSITWGSLFLVQLYIFKIIEWESFKPYLKLR